MTHVGFYVLADTAPDAAPRFACRLIEKIHGQGRRVYWRLADEAACRAADELLWTFRQGSFVPHARTAALTGEDDPTPVVLGTEEPPPGFDDTLVNLHPEVPDFFSRFERAVEIVTPETQAAGRERYRFYKERGYPLETHKIA